MMRLGLGGLELSSCGRGVGFDPAHLFASGEVGFVEPMLPGVTLFQDAAGTIPVTAPGQPVGLSKFTAGGRPGFVQATALNRPIYQIDAQGRGYLAHNGVNQWMVAADFAWGSDAVTMCVGLRKLSDASVGVVTEFSPNAGASNGAFYVAAPASLVEPGRNEFLVRGTLSQTVKAVIAAPLTCVVTAFGKISTDTAVLRINGAQAAQSTSDQGSGGYGTYPLYAGARAGTSLFFNGNRYPSMGINRLLTEAELAQVEAWVNQRTGAF